MEHKNELVWKGVAHISDMSEVEFLQIESLFLP